MASVNKVIILGNLGADPESRFAPSGDAVCNIRVATSETWRDKTLNATFKGAVDAAPLRLPFSNMLTRSA